MLLCACVIVFLTNVLSKKGAPDLFSIQLLLLSSKTSSQLPVNMQALASWALGPLRRTAANLIIV